MFFISVSFFVDNNNTTQYMAVIVMLISKQTMHQEVYKRNF